MGGWEFGLRPEAALGPAQPAEHIPAGTRSGQRKLEVAVGLPRDGV